MSQFPQQRIEFAESELILRVCNGDQEAFYQLLRPYEHAIFIIARSVLRNHADAEEACQEAILKAFIHIRSFRAKCKFSTWLIGIVINESRMKLRKEHRYLYEWVNDHRSRKGGQSWPKDYAVCRELPSDVLERKELQQALRRALNSLAAQYREVLVLRHLQQISVAETAAMLGLSEENVRTRSLRARSQMRRALAPIVIGVTAIQKTGDAGARCGRAPRSPSCPNVSISS